VDDTTRTVSVLLIGHRNRVTRERYELAVRRHTKDAEGERRKLAEHHHGAGLI